MSNKVDPEVIKRAYIEYVPFMRSHRFCPKTGKEVSLIMQSCDDCNKMCGVSLSDLRTAPIWKEHNG